MKQTYIIASGYYDGTLHDTDDRKSLACDEFIQTWMQNTFRYAHPQRVYIVRSGGFSAAMANCPSGVEWVNVENIGHASTGEGVQRMAGSQQISGWSASFLMGCMLAYHNNADLIYKEQDCLAFGNWVNRLYSELGESGNVITGKPNVGGLANGLQAQSLVLVKHRYLLALLRNFLLVPVSCAQMQSEVKFQKIADNTWRRTGMGYDRTRPFRCTDEAWYAQQFSLAEFADLKAIGLI